MTDLLVVIIAVSIGAPVGIFLSRVAEQVWYAIHDRIEDTIRRHRRETRR